LREKYPSSEGKNSTEEIETQKEIGTREHKTNNKNIKNTLLFVTT